MLLKMAYRNIYRHRNRTVLTLITIIFGIFVAILGEGLNAGLEKQLINTYINTDIGEDKIYAEGFYEDRDENDPLEYQILHEKEIFAALEGTDFSARLNFSGTVTDGENELRIRFLGVDSDSENRVFERSAYMLSGSFEMKGDAVVAGSGAAELLGIRTGDHITVMTRTAAKSLNALDVVVTGIIRTGNPLIDDRVIFLSLETAKKFTLASASNDIVVKGKISDRAKIESLSAEIIGWETETEDVFRITRIRRRVFSFISLLILIMAGVGIANTMIMAMMERKKETGVLMANGMSSSEVKTLFLFEGLTVGVIGSFTGALLGAAAVLYYQRTGIPIGVDGMSFDLPMSDRIFMSLEPVTLMIYFLTGIIVSVTATLYPAFRAAASDPADVMRD